MSADTAIYLRHSPGSDDGPAVADQEADCRRLAAKLGWRVAAVYVDRTDGVASGSLRQRRPEYQRMTADIDTGAIQAVIVWDTDRLTRTPHEIDNWNHYTKVLGLKIASARPAGSGGAA
ncbi:hypothetical protein GCM10027059_12460 [Myceligenerans halotolerans]